MDHKTSTSDTVDMLIKRIQKLAAENERRPQWPDDEKKSQTIEKLKAWGVPIRLAEDVNGEVIDTKPLKFVSRWMQSKDPSGWCLVLSSPKGTGKSTAGAWWLNEIADKYELSRVKRWWSSSTIARMNSYDPAFEKMFLCQAMVIDDLGAEYLDKNGYFQQKFDEIIDARYSRYRKTLITTNLNARAFTERYGERVSDRIRHGFEGGGAFVEFSDSSLRIPSVSKKQEGKGKQG